MFEKNPEVNNGEVAKLIWMKIDDALKLENLYPNQIQNYIENL